MASKEMNQAPGGGALIFIEKVSQLFRGCSRMFMDFASAKTNNGPPNITIVVESNVFFPKPVGFTFHMFIFGGGGGHFRKVFP